ncbi:WD40 repeat-like protein [Myriangium duriaei CBS 260.36]|uniref:WD40 repeat-like protein n=1 Tax=Myriangium duriaei CBS 260.36 TaxID=1168546 RepID=A0A9P4J3Z0_9PEZI|nr:WD40 repeat-like protein [Myriangium duriaei CBS 260.36]
MATIPQHLRPRPDEGYSEALSEPASDVENESSMMVDMVDSEDGVLVESRDIASQGVKMAEMLMKLDADGQKKLFASMISALPLGQRNDLAKASLAAMPTSYLARIVAECDYRLHINPVNKLPFELTEIVMQNLSPTDVVRCSMTSRGFRSRALDSQLWKLFYLQEGWRVDIDAIRNLTHSKNRRKHESSVEVRGSRKRQRDLDQSDVPANDVADTRDWNEQHGTVEADEDQQMTGNESGAGGRSTLADMEGLGSLTPNSSEAPSPREQSHGHQLNEGALQLHDYFTQLVPPISPQLTYTNGSAVSLNWLWLYKQRRRLESNWDAGRYKPFQLPRPEHPEEAHDECVYTIQFSGDYLVSGSRDKTIKVWQLSTQKCLRTLKGQHDQSVLCLQFDPVEDIIVSGGSDSYVVIWRFRDGELIRRMTSAHRESVLNLRFDERYLITCSKDKTIKIWNRKPIMSNDMIIPGMSRGRFPQEDPIMLEPYTELGSLGGHGAAVNAIQIYKDTIVSASGDRTIRMWNIQTGECLKDFSGHSKGIACVQFDGRRVVSGSSDNTVRIFDAATQGEVACLQGHTNLVRTVQARFGDKSVTDEELEKLARETQDRWTRDLDSLARLPSGNMPRDAFAGIHGVSAINTKIPQGGGGNRWSRIVSGSYDETVIIWKKDTNGEWIVNRRLHQDEILASARARAARQRTPVLPHHGHGPPQVPAQPHAGPARAGHAHPQPHAGPAAQPHHVAAPGHPVPGQHNAHPAAHTNLQHANFHRQRLLMPHQQGRVRGGVPVAGAQAPMLVEENNSNRVFKLQFDARRIVCCSQNKTIVGWDFANADKNLEEASKYFAETD